MKRYSVATAALIAVLVSSASVISTLKVYASKGPRSDLDIIFYSSSDAAWATLVNGQADMLQWPLTETQKQQAESNPDIQLARFDECDSFEFDINNNYSIKSYPGVRSATNELKVRQAIASLIDKDYIITHILGDFGIRIDQPIAAPQTAGWANASCIGSNYPYPYDPQAAADLLAEAGFADTDHNGWLNYPADWPGAPGADTTTYPLVTCVRNDAAYRQASGQYLINQLEVTLAGTSIGAGFKTTGIQWHRDRIILNPKVLGNRDYHIYTGGWSFGRYPTYLHYLFNSQFWYPYGPNYITGMNENNQPNYPDVDAVTETIWNPHNMTEARNAAQRFCYLHSGYCINIPLWSTSGFWAYRKELVGVVNAQVSRLENDYTFLNAYRKGGGPIRLAAIQAPDQLNILYSLWYVEYAFLNRVYPFGINFQPYDVDLDQPWVIQDWETGTWNDEGTTKSMCTYYIRKDVGIVTPVTGTHVRDWDADDFEFSVWYNYAFSDSWQFSLFQDVKYTKIVDVNGDGWDELQVFFDYYEYWSFASPTYPLLMRDELIDPLCGQKTETWSQTGTSTHSLESGSVDVVGAMLDGTPIFEGVDFEIYAGYGVGSHTSFHALRDLTGTVSITYWYADVPADGFYLAGLPWQQTMYSIGTHYPVSMTHDPPAAGDTISLARNEHFFLESPILGEIDWAWKWSGTTRPRSGNYRIDIFDLTRATSAYCTRGDSAFDPEFFNGADLDPTDLCHIGIFDLVTITSAYGKTFGEPPA
jgi:hypothetical protein